MSWLSDSNYVEPLPVFPSYSAGSEGGPVYGTSVYQADSGRIALRREWDDEQGAAWRLSLSHCDTPELLNLFMCCSGRHLPFLFKDSRDFSAVGEVLSGSDTTYQLAKTYDYDGTPVVRTIYRPIPSTVTVYDDGDAVLPHLFWVNYSTGLVTFQTAPAGPVTADFEFYLLSRFESDQLEIESQGPLDTVSHIEIVAVREA